MGYACVKPHILYLRTISIQETNQPILTSGHWSGLFMCNNFKHTVYCHFTATEILSIAPLSYQVLIYIWMKHTLTLKLTFLSTDLSQYWPWGWLFSVLILRLTFFSRGPTDLEVDLFQYWHCGWPFPVLTFFSTDLAADLSEYWPWGWFWWFRWEQRPWKTPQDWKCQFSLRTTSVCYSSGCCPSCWKHKKKKIECVKFRDIRAFNDHINVQN